MFTFICLTALAIGADDSDDRAAALKKVAGDSRLLSLEVDGEPALKGKELRGSGKILLSISPSGQFWATSQKGMLWGTVFVDEEVGWLDLRDRTTATFLSALYRLSGDRLHALLAGR